MSRNEENITRHRLLHILAKCIFPALIANLAFNPIARADSLDGVLNTDFGTQGYFAYYPLMDTWIISEKLNDGLLLIGGQKNGGDVFANNHGNLITIPADDCVSNSNVGSITKLNFDLTPVNSFGGFGTGGFNIAFDANTVFTAAAETANHEIFIAGYHNNVNKIINGRGYSCEQSNHHNFILKLDSQGEFIMFDGDKIEKNLNQTNNLGTITDLVILNNDTLVLSYNNYPRGYLYFTDFLGNPKSAIGINGFVYLDSSLITPSGLTILGDSILVNGTIQGDSNPNVGDANWALTSVSFQGKELNTFKGTRNYLYSDGQKEGIFYKPVIYDQNIYFLGTVLSHSSSYELKTLKMSLAGELDTEYGRNLNTQFSDMGITHCSYCEGQFVVDDYGRLIVAIGSDSFTDEGFRKSYVVRLNTDGYIDTSFGDAGKMEIFFDYQAKIVNLQNNNFGIYGDLNNSHVIGSAFHYNYGTALAKFVQTPPTQEINVNIESKDDRSANLNLSNYDSNTVVTLSSDVGQIYFDSSTAKARIVLPTSGRKKVNLSVVSKVAGQGPFIKKFSFFTEYSSAELNAIATAEKEEKARAEAERIAELRRQAELRKANAIAIISDPNKIDQLSITAFTQAGIVGLNEDIYSGFLELFLKLPPERKGNPELLNKNLNNLKRTFYLSKLSSSFSASNLVNAGFTGVNAQNVNEVSRIVISTNYLDEQNFDGIQKIISQVNILSSGRLSGTLSLSQLNKLEIKFSIPEKTGQVMLKFQKLKPEIFDTIFSVQQEIDNISKVIQDRLKRTLDGKAKTQAIKEKLASRGK